MTPANKLDPPFRADHVGSLIRPATLRTARQAFLAGRLPPEALKPLEDAAIREAVKLQEDAGLRSVTDGEFRRTTWRDGFMLALEGMSKEWKEPDFHFRNAHGEHRPARPVPDVIGRLKRTSGVATEEFAFLKATTGRTPKITLPSPTNLHFFRGDAAIDRSIYPDIDDFFADAARVYREEIAALAALGCTYVQLDEVPLALICDPDNQAIIRRRGEDVARTIDRYVVVINAALRDRPPGLTVALHLCRGNGADGWYIGDGGYDFIAERLFNDLDVDAYFLEYDTARAGDFAPLRFVPKGKTVALGLMTTKSPALESPDALKRRLDEAGGHVGLGQLCLCPQCGFASGFGAAGMTEDQERAKLDLLVRVARGVWGD